MTTRSMTYEEIADAFGIAGKSARQLVHRKRWSRHKGNDGRMRIDVPLDAIPPPSEGPSEAPSEGPSKPPSEIPSEGPSEAPAILFLMRLVERLENELADLRPKAAERDVLAVQVEAIKGALDAASKRLVVLEEERDAERARAADRDALAGQVEALRSVLEAAKGREEELRGERDRWALQAHALAHPPVPPAPASVPSRGFFGWFRAVRR